MEEPHFLLAGLRLKKRRLANEAARAPATITAQWRWRQNQGGVCAVSASLTGCRQDGGGILMAAMMSAFILRTEAATHAANRKAGSQRAAGNASLPLRCGFHHI